MRAIPPNWKVEPREAAVVVPREDEQASDWIEFETQHVFNRAHRKG